MNCKNIFLVFIFSFLCFCDSNSNADTDCNSVDTTLNLNVTSSKLIDSLKHYLVCEKLFSVNSQKLPLIVADFLTNNSDYTFQLSDNFTFYLTPKNNNYTVAKIEYLKPYSGLEILCICVTNETNSNFENYFYFLELLNNKWVDITKSFMSNKIIDLLQQQNNISLKYQNINTVTYCVSDVPINFNFASLSEILFWNNIKWEKICDIKINKNKILLINNNQNSLLSSEDLEKAKVYSSLQLALHNKQDVYVLDMSNIGITDIDTAVFLLTKIQTLVMENNKINLLPENIKNLINLQYLRISSNNLLSLPHGLNDLKYIEEISIRNNQLTDLHAVENLSNLKILNADNNNLSNNFLDFSNLKNIIILNLSDNNITNLPKSICNLHDLAFINISNNPINSLPNEFYQLKNITYIDATNTNIPENQLIKLYENNPEIQIIMN